VGDPITEPGLHVKSPFVQTVNRLDRRFLEWDGAPVAIPTKDKTYIHVDTFARWKITDAKTYFVRLHDERSAQSRLEDILGSETQQIAQRFRAEGEGEAARIAGQRERDLNEITSGAYLKVQQIRGKADAEATAIYARAYTQNPQAAEFYAFMKSMETYRKVFA